MVARGIRLNNPGNLRISNQSWLGKVAPSKDHDFETFDTLEHGIRAIAKIILNDYHHGMDTIEDIISKYAPSSENDTAAYIASVCAFCGYDANAHLMLTTLTDLMPIVQAIIIHENGSCPYTDEQIKNGCQMALLLY